MQQRQQASQESLSRPDSLMLVGLMNGPKHAVALWEAIEQAEGVFIEPGTLYRMLARLEQRGWIEGLDVEGSLRLYRITALGMLALESAEVGSQREKLREGRRPALRRGKEIIVLLVVWMLRLYPPAWRERYEAEIVALLEQHEITLWTVLDLFVGALDARLDPHYRRSQQVLPLQRLQASWKLLASALLACWLSLLLWFGMWDPGPVLAAHTPPLAQAIVGGMSLLLFFFLFPFLLILSGWIAVQAMKRARNLLRLLPVGLFILLCILLFQNGWFNGLFLVMFFVSLALVAESGGAMLISARSWERRHNRLLALLVLSGMVAACIATGACLVDLWDVLPIINSGFSGMSVQLLLGFVIMVVAVVTALIAFVRTVVTWRAVSAAPNSTSSLPQSEGIGPKVGSIVFAVGVFLCLGLLMSGFMHVTPTMLLLILLCTGLGGMMIVLSMKRGGRKRTALPNQEPL